MTASGGEYNVNGIEAGLVVAHEGPEDTGIAWPHPRFGEAPRSGTGIPPPEKECSPARVHPADLPAPEAMSAFGAWHRGA